VSARSATPEGSAHPVVGITRCVPVRGRPVGEPPLIEGCRVVMGRAEPQMSRGELLEFVRGAGASAVITMFHDRVDAEFLEAAASSGVPLRGVCNFAVGYDNIDVDACRARGVWVSNTPDAVTEGTANLAWALLLAAGRRLVEADRFVRSGRWAREGNGFPAGWCGVHLTGQTLLIVGAGRIGRAVALRGTAFGMRVEYVARRRHLEFEQAPLAARRVDLDEALPRADAVSIHVPLTPQTRGLIDARRLGLMKPTAVLVNTARGPIIDEGALAEALASRRIWGAGLDVFEREPEVHPGLLTLDNVVLSPHIGSAEGYWREEMTRLACESAAAAAHGRRPPNCVEG
jgi:lactate dehydrogenase-like 2-hydroxyacid dehydrogenase